VKTQRDEWVYDFFKPTLENKMRYFIGIYQGTLRDGNFPGRLKIKWDRELTKYLAQGIEKEFDRGAIASSLYRPFTVMHLYFDRHFNGMTYQLPSIFPNAASDNLAVCFTDAGSEKPFMCLVTNKVPDLHLVGAGSSAQCLPLYRYVSGERADNITDWALAQFREHYGVRPGRAIERLDIFHYVYAVLHHPTYRQKYERNLKREFPRIPFYDDFWRWAGWGQQLMDLHLNYEQADPYPLAREDKDLAGLKPTPRLIARKEAGAIEVDTLTTLRGVPPEAWEYRLGTYSVLEWVLERHKERTPRDPTIREKFNTYRFTDYKEPVIDLLRRVCTVSVETMRIVGQMPGN
jgi:predicted helicase